MNDLILRTRIEVLKQNLGQVELVVDSVQQRRTQLLKLFELLNPREQILQLDDTVEAVNGARTLVKSLEDSEESKRILDKLSKVKGSVENFQGKLNEVQKAIESMQTYQDQMREDAFGAALKVLFGSKARNCISGLEEIDEIIKEAEKAQRAGNSQTAEELLKEAWERYTDEVKKSQPIFKEYFDFLGGLALRDTYVDWGAYLIADKLIQQWADDTDTQWRSLTIPAREEPLEIGLARMIRLGFPEWTIWALPLTARGFWYIMKNGDLWRTHFESHPIDQLPADQLYNYLADAFATFTMGPAYACAALLLRFNPKGEEQPDITKRAYIVFSSLKQMNKRSRIEAYKPLIQRLEGEWDAALQQVTFNSPEYTLQDSDKELLDRLVDYFWKFMDSNTLLIYPPSRWLQIQDWPAKLVENEGVKAISPDLAELRDVLNAAWLSRLDHLDKSDAIARAALSLWEKIAARKSRGGVSSTVGQYRPAPAPVRDDPGKAGAV